MYLILKCDLIHLYLDKCKTKFLGRREYKQTNVNDFDSKCRRNDIADISIYNVRPALRFASGLFMFSLKIQNEMTFKLHVQLETVFIEAFLTLRFSKLEHMLIDFDKKNSIRGNNTSGA